MSWNETQGETSGITYTEWNDMVTCILNISSNSILFSSNAKNISSPTIYESLENIPQCQNAKKIKEPRLIQ